MHSEPRDAVHAAVVSAVGEAANLSPLSPPADTLWLRSVHCSSTVLCPTRNRSFLRSHSASRQPAVQGACVCVPQRLFATCSTRR